MFNDRVDSGKREYIFDSYGIDFPVIKYWLETSVLFLDIEDGGSIRGLRFSDEASVELFLDVFLLELFFGSREGIDLAGY